MLVERDEPVLVEKVDPIIDGKTVGYFRQLVFKCLIVAKALLIYIRRRWILRWCFRNSVTKNEMPRSKHEGLAGLYIHRRRFGQLLTIPNCRNAGEQVNIVIPASIGRNHPDVAAGSIHFQKLEYLGVRYALGQNRRHLFQ